MDDKHRVALVSVFASAGLTLAKAVVGVLSGSLAILSEAAHSFIDFVATLMTYYAVRVSGKPADDEHQFGHGKVESVSALIETGLLFVLCFAVGWEALRRLLFDQGHAVEASLLAFAVIAVSVVVDFFRARALNRVAKETSSQALEADALHFSSDMYSSIAVFIGLGGIAAGFQWADSAAAGVVAIFVCIAGWRLGKRTIDTLVDRAPEGATERIRTVTGSVAGLVGIDHLRVRPAGDVMFVELEAAVSRTLPLDRVQAIRGEITNAIRAEFPRAQVVISTAPRALDDESVMERIMVIARNRALAVHHVTVHTVGDMLTVSLDLEVDGHLPLGTAHKTASDLEDAISAELGSDVEVETHIEPLEPTDASGIDLGPQRAAEIRALLDALLPPEGPLTNVHHVRVRHTADGEIVNFHCWASPALTVQFIHEKVDELERALRQRAPDIKRVIGHAEPHT